MSRGAWRDPVGRSRQRPRLPGSKIHCELFKNNSGPDENHWSGTVKFVLYFIRMASHLVLVVKMQDTSEIQA